MLASKVGSNDSYQNCSFENIRVIFNRETKINDFVGGGFFVQILSLKIPAEVKYVVYFY